MDLLLGTYHFSTNYEEVLSHMYANVKSYPHVSYDEITHTPIAFGRLKRNLNLHSLQEPSFFENEHIILQFTGRLDNKTTLLKKYDLLPNTSVNQIIANLYLIKGNAIVNEIEGDWVVTIWNKEKQELFIARDHLGVTGLFYHKNKNFFCFSSSLKAITKLTNISKKLHHDYLISILLTQKLHNGITAYEEIIEIPPGHYVVVTKNSVSTIRYWFLENTSELHFKDPREYYEGLLEKLTLSIQQRIEPNFKIGSTLSSGLDSSTITILASQILEKSNQKIQSLTFTPSINLDYLDTTRWKNNEYEKVKSILNLYPNIQNSQIQVHTPSFVSIIEKILQEHQLPKHSMRNIAWIYTLLEKAKEKNVQTLLIGQGGNSGISWHGLNQPSFSKRIKSEIKKILFHSSKNDINNQFINPELIKNQEYKNYIKEYENDFIYSTNKSIQARSIVTKQDKTSLGSIWQNNGYIHNLQILDPTFDKNVMEYCFAIPDKFHRDNQSDRLIIRNATKNILPNEIRLNTTRGRQGSDIIHLITENKNEIKKNIGLFQQNELVNHFINISKMLEFINEAKKQNDFVNADNFMRCYGLAFFIHFHNKE